MGKEELVECTPEQCVRQQKLLVQGFQGKESGEISRGEIYSQRDNKNKLLSMVIVATSGNSMAG
jgi:hypothetical protein